MVDNNFSCALVDLLNRFCFTMYITLIKSYLYILYTFACYLYIVVVCFIYSRTLAPGATVICWLYPTQNEFYLILSYLIDNYSAFDLAHKPDLDNVKYPFSLWVVRIVQNLSWMPNVMCYKFSNEKFKGMLYVRRYVASAKIYNLVDIHLS